MMDEWLKLKSLQEIRNKLIAQLGLLPTGLDDTIVCCQELFDIPMVSRSKYIQDNWGRLTHKDEFLLDQLKRIEQDLAK